MPNEHDLRRKVSKWFEVEMRAKRLWYVKVVGSRFQRAGVPDYILAVEGRFGAIELKRPDGKGTLATKQKNERAKIQSAGGAPSIVAESLLEVVAFVAHLRAGVVVVEVEDSEKPPP